MLFTVLKRFSIANILFKIVAAITNSLRPFTARHISHSQRGTCRARPQKVSQRCLVSHGERYRFNHSLHLLIFYILLDTNAIWIDGSFVKTTIEEQVANNLSFSAQGSMIKTISIIFDKGAFSGFLDCI